MKSRESEYVEIMCGVFEDRYAPLSRAEFWRLYHQHGDSVLKMAESNDERIVKLMERSGAIAFDKEKMDQMGIRISTFLDDDFPVRLYEKLADFCPPVLYCCGGSSVLDNKFVGYVGSRSIDESDLHWTEERVKKNIHDGFSVVTGGAKGIDSAAMNCALNSGGRVCLFLPDNIKEKLREAFIRQHIGEGNLFVCSHISPFAAKSRQSFVAAAMERNKYIYALSNGTVVVRSDLKKGGTWSGAVETMKHKWAPVFVWDNKKYPGNQELILMGGRGLSDDGSIIESENGEVNDQSQENKGATVSDNSEKNEMRQMTIFDLLNKNGNS